MSRSIALLTEDRYGCEFIRRLLSRLNCSHKLGKVERLAGVCNSKSGRQVRALYDWHSKIIVLVDAHGRDPEKVKEDTLSHMRNLSNKVKVITLPYSIEEWVCLGLGLRFSNDPLDSLKRHIDYEKFMLPRLAEKLDIDALYRSLPFKELISEFMR